MASSILDIISHMVAESGINNAYIKDVLKEKIKIDPEERKVNIKIVLDFVAKLIDMMKKTDELFRALFSKIYPTGSSFENLRITDAREFDIDLVLNFPIAKRFRQVERMKRRPCYGMYKLEEGWLTSDPNKRELLEKIGKRFVQRNYILPEKIRQWMQSILYRLDPNEMRKVPGIKKIRISESGPAKTPLITTTYGYEISLDLVPVIEFRSPELPLGIDKTPVLKYGIDSEDCFCFLVPKPFSVDDLTKVEIDRMWRIHFPAVEKAIIHDIGCVKPVIKLMKLLRDKQNWVALSSYYLKTVVMGLVLINPKDYWHEKFMDKRFKEALEKLLQCLNDRIIPHILYPSYNLLDKVRPEHAANMAGQLRRILRSDFKNIEKYL